MNNKKFFIVGCAAGFALLVLYFGILSLVNSFSHAVSEFGRMWYWVLLLAGGFGLQVGLYTFIRDAIRQKQMKGATGAVVASGTLSTGSMIACCLHHLTDVLPLLGLAAATLFLLKYQTFFILIGVLSNFVGIAIMLEIIQKNTLGGDLLKKFLIGDMSKIKKIIITLSAVLALITFLVIAKSKPSKTTLTRFAISGFLSENLVKVALLGKAGDTIPNDVVKNLPSITNEQAGISFEVKLLDFNFDEQVKFEIKITTHTGSLDFDLIKISILEDDEGNQYQPLDWQGSPPGGHHREGILAFDKLKEKSKSIRLIIKDGLSPRIFEWSLE